MAEHQCPSCGHKPHWSEAFAKFGYNDGDGIIYTPIIAQALEGAGYSVKYSRWSPHNTLIYSIQKYGIEYMPLYDPATRIGYDDPRDYLAQDVTDLLDQLFGEQITTFVTK